MTCFARFELLRRVARPLGVDEDSLVRVEVDRQLAQVLELAGAVSPDARWTKFVGTQRPPMSIVGSI